MDLRREKKTENIPDLPENITLAETGCGEDCFFDSVAQSLRQIKPDEEINTKSLREICRRYAMKYDWVKLAVATDARLKSSIEETVKDSDMWKKYLFAIEYTSEDMVKMKDNEEHLLYAALTESEHGDTLIAPIWGRCEIEGRVICDKYKVKLHVIENHDVKGEVWAHKIVDSSCSKYVDSVNYNVEDTIHLVNTGNLHFRPLLFKACSNHKSEQNSQYSKQQNSSDYNGSESHIESDEYRANTGKDSDSARKVSTIENELKLVNNSSTLFSVYNVEDETVGLYLDSGLRIDDEESDIESEPAIEILERFAKPDVNTAINQQVCDVAEVSITSCKVENYQKERFHRKKGAAGASGHFYEIKLSTFLFLKGLSEKIEYFYLASNLDEAHTFDDIVFKYKHVGSNKPNILFIQTKHKDELRAKDKKEASFKRKFSFQKFFVSYLKIKQQFNGVSSGHPIFGGNFNDCDFIIYTNLPPGPGNGQGAVTEAKGFLKVAASEDCILNFLHDEGSEPVNRYYMLNDESKSKEILNNLYNSSDCMRLARELAKSVFSSARNFEELEINLTKDIFKKYRIPLAQNVFEMGENAGKAVFRESFLNGDEGLSVHEREFRRAFFKEAKKISNKKCNAHLKSELRSKDVKISKTFWNTGSEQSKQSKLNLPIDSVDPKNIKEFLGKLKLFLNQPNEVELGTIIKRVVQEMYRIDQPDIDSVFHSLMGKITNWWQKEDYYLTKDDKFLENILRVSVFTVEGHVESFTGREKELRQLRTSLQRNDTKCRITVISHMTAVSGLGGIGKTELARKYAHDYKHFYDGNVLWINAESYSSLCSSFLSLAQHKKINIPTEHRNGKEKSVKNVVSEIFDFFAKRKSLFIFDNAERSGDVNQFLPLLPLTLDSNKPYILITSREREWERGIEVLEITDLELKDAIEFVAKYLNITDGSQEDEIRILVNTLQCFPLALQQAVAHIAHQRIVGKFNILDYLKEYKIKTEQLLKSTEFQGIGSSYAKTTYTTWQITFDKIKTDTNCGGLATEILNIAGYLSPEDIERKFFYNLPDAVQGDVNEAVRLLVNYSMIGAKEQQSILNIHRLVQHVTRLNLEKDRVSEERVLRKTLELIYDFNDGLMRTTKHFIEHFVSVWKYVSKYCKLIDEFFFKNSWDHFGHSPLEFLDENDSYEEFEAILEHIRKKDPDNFSELIKERNRNTCGTLLHRAAINANLNAVKYLVTNGATVDFKCACWDENAYRHMQRKMNGVPTYPFFEDGIFSFHEWDTPLHCAAYSGNEDVVDYLISKGANVNAMNKSNATPLHIACIFGNVSVANLLLAKGANVNVSGVYETSLDCACAFGNLDLVKLLIKAGADTDATCDTYGKFYTTPLHVAALAQNLNVLEYLLDNGANVSVKNSWGKTPLHYVSQQGSLSSVKYLLDKDADFNSPDNSKRTPLHLAAEEGHSEVVRLLHEKGADFNAPDNFNRTPLHLAAEEGHLEVVRLLHEKGANLNLPENHGNTPLHMASRARHFDVVKFIVENGADFDIPNNSGDTPLHIAAETCHFDVLKFLVLKGADFISPNNYGSTPLLLCVKSKLSSKPEALKIVTYLIEKGVDFITPDNEGNTPVYLAFRRQKFEISRVLIEKGANCNYSDKNGRTPMHWAAQNGVVELVKLLVENGGDFNTPDENGNTPLHHAAANIHPDVLKYLMGKGADFQSPNNHGRSPIHLAAEMLGNGFEEIIVTHKHLFDCSMETEVERTEIDRKTFLDLLSEESYDVVRSLIRNGANFETLDKDNRAPIHLAAKAGNTAVVKLLIEKGADFNSPDKYGCTPLHLAAGMRNKNELNECILDHLAASVRNTDGLNECDTVRILVENGANFQILDADKRAPIHTAALYGNTGIVKFLLEKGADFKSPDKYGYTPFHLAVGNDHMNVVRLLLEKRVDVNLPDNDGNTPLHLAYAHVHSRMTDLLESKGADSTYRNNYGNEPINSAAAAKKDQRLFTKMTIDMRIREFNVRPRYIHWVSRWDSLNEVELFVEKGADFTVRNTRGCTPLHLAAQNDNRDTVEFLIGKGADFSCADTNGNTPLHLAIAAGDEERRKLRTGTVNADSHTAMYLINKGVRLDSRDNNGKTPMHWAAKTRKFDIMRLLVEKGADINCLDRDQKTPLHWAAEKGCLAAVKLLAERGADLDCTDKDNRTPLHWAAKEGHLDIVKFLVTKGTDFNLYEKNGNTPLHVAASYGQFYVVKFLLSEGADFNSRENSGNTPLHLAARRGKLDVVMHLVENGCDLHVKNKKGRTPLQCAASSGKLNVVHYLITKEDDFYVNAKDYNGNTLLSSAASAGNLAVVKFLIEKRKADFETVNSSGNTPLHLAAFKGALCVVKYFVEELHADLKSINNVGNTTLHLAAQKGALNVVKYLVEEKNVDFKVLNHSGDTALHLAASIGSLGIVKYLKEHKNCDTELSNSSGDTPLHLAARKGSICVVKYLAENKTVI